MRAVKDFGLGTFLLLGATALTLGCASSPAKPKEPVQPTVEQVGSTVVKYVGQDVELAMSYRFAAGNLGLEWLLVDLAATGTHQESTELKRQKIALKTPSGDIIPLPPQQELADDYSSIRSADRRADVAGEPLRYWGGRRSCTLNFLVEPGTGLAMDSIWVNEDRVCQGRLYFPMPGGVQPGPYELRIDLKESKVRMPFKIGVK
jgi:hypothetical protein